MKTETKYFNFPVCLLKDFLLETSTDKCLNQICDYSIYAHSQLLEYGTEMENFNSASKFFNVKLGNANQALKNGKALFSQISPKAPKVGINLDIFWDYFKNEKSEHEKACLLAFLAIKSILQNKTYCKITNNFWLSRMAGNYNSESIEFLPDNLKFYSSEYQTRKLKTELKNNWGLKTYSRYTRGFYVSFKLPLEQLVFEAEKKRKSTLEKQYKKLEQEAIAKAIQKLNQNNGK